MDDHKNPKQPGFEGTMVDLGEDLLEGATSSVIDSSSVPKSDDDELQRGEILMGERLFEDAKKVFRKLLRKDPSNSKVKTYLDEIQKIEIQDLLGGEPVRKRFGAAADDLQDAPTLVVERLERELQLNVEKEDQKIIPDLFPDETTFQKYKEQILTAASALPPQERLDIGIAHLEMGLFEVAQAVFETVVRHEDWKVVGMYLLGLSLIHGGKAIEATIQLEPIARDLTISESAKTDFLYLMGLAFERLADFRKAREFYRRVSMLNPKYRDVQEKLIAISKF